MATIQLSALANGIKGKIGGSSFVSSPAGTILKMNGVHSGKKSSKRTLQNSRLSSISSRWKSLSSAEREAWNNNATMFSGKNKFGEPRPLSGFELFCQVNTVQISAGRSVSNIPPVPVSFPAVPELELVMFDAFQFNGSTSFGGAEVIASEAINKELVYKSDSITTFTDGVHINFNYMLSADYVSKCTTAEGLNMFKMFNDNYEVSITCMGVVAGVIKFDLLIDFGTTNVLAMSTSVGVDTVGVVQNMDLEFTSSLGKPARWKPNRYTEYLLELVEWTNQPPGDTEDIQIGSSLNDFIEVPFISNLQIVNGELSSTETKAVCLNYVLDSAKYFFPLSENYGLSNVAPLGAGGKFELDESVKVFTLLDSFSNEVNVCRPLLTLEGLGTGSAGFSYQVFLSPSVNAGRDGALSARYMLGEVASDAGNDVVLNDSFDSIKFAGVGSVVRCWVELVHIASGLKSGGKVKVKHKGSRFKPGAELNQ